MTHGGGRTLPSTPTQHQAGPRTAAQEQQEQQEQREQTEQQNIQWSEKNAAMKRATRKAIQKARREDIEKARRKAIEKARRKATEKARRKARREYTKNASPEDQKVFSDAKDTENLVRRTQYRIRKQGPDSPSHGTTPEGRAAQDTLNQAKHRWEELQNYDAMKARSQHEKYYAKKHWKDFVPRDILVRLFSNRQELKDPIAFVNAAPADTQALALNCEGPGDPTAFADAAPADRQALALNGEEHRDPTDFVNAAPADKQAQTMNGEEPRDPTAFVTADRQAIAPNSEQPRNPTVYVDATPHEMEVLASNDEEPRGPKPNSAVDPPDFGLGLGFVDQIASAYPFSVHDGSSCGALPADYPVKVELDPAKSKRDPLMNFPAMQTRINSENDYAAKDSRRFLESDSTVRGLISNDQVSKDHITSANATPSDMQVAASTNEETSDPKPNPTVDDPAFLLGLVDQIASPHLVNGHDSSSCGALPADHPVQVELDPAESKWDEPTNSSAKQIRTASANHYESKDCRRFPESDSPVQGLVWNEKEPQDPSSSPNAKQSHIQVLGSNNDRPRDRMPTPTGQSTDSVLGQVNRTDFTDAVNDYLTTLMTKNSVCGTCL